MGRPAAITYEQVKEYMDARRAEGARPTIDDVWEGCGSKGSRGTVHKLVKRYQAEAAESEKTPESLRLLPPEVTRVFLAFCDQTASAAREAIAADLREYQQRADILAEDNERLNAVLAERDEQLEQGAAEKADLRVRLSQLTTELAAAREQTAQERAALQSTTTELAKAQQRLDEVANMKDELSKVREQYEAESRARVAAELAIADVKAQKDLLEERSQHLAASLAGARSACERLEAKNAELAAEASTAQRELAVVTALTQARPRPKAGKAVDVKTTPLFDGDGAGEGTAPAD